MPPPKFSKLVLEYARKIRAGEVLSARQALRLREKEFARDVFDAVGDRAAFEKLAGQQYTSLQWDKIQANLGPRRLETNPRALGTNPRATETNPRALRAKDLEERKSFIGPLPPSDRHPAEEGQGYRERAILGLPTGENMLGRIGRSAVGQAAALPRALYELAEVPSTLAGVRAPSVAQDVPVVGELGRWGDTQQEESGLPSLQQAIIGFFLPGQRGYQPGRMRMGAPSIKRWPRARTNYPNRGLDTLQREALTVLDTAEARVRRKMIERGQGEDILDDREVVNEIDAFIDQVLYPNYRRADDRLWNEIGRIVDSPDYDPAVGAKVHPITEAESTRHHGSLVLAMRARELAAERLPRNEVPPLPFDPEEWEGLAVSPIPPQVQLPPPPGTQGELFHPLEPGMYQRRRPQLQPRDFNPETAAEFIPGYGQLGFMDLPNRVAPLPSLSVREHRPQRWEQFSPGEAYVRNPLLGEDPYFGTPEAALVEGLDASEADRITRMRELERALAESRVPPGAREETGLDLVGPSGRTPGQRRALQVEMELDDRLGEFVTGFTTMNGRRPLSRQELSEFVLQNFDTFFGGGRGPRR